MTCQRRGGSTAPYEKHLVWADRIVCGGDGQDSLSRRHPERVLVSLSRNKRLDWRRDEQDRWQEVRMRIIVFHSLREEHWLLLWSPVHWGKSSIRLRYHKCSNTIPSMNTLNQECANPLNEMFRTETEGVWRRRPRQSMREIIFFTLICFLRGVAYFIGLPNAMIPKFESVLTTFDYVKPWLSSFGGSVF